MDLAILAEAVTRRFRDDAGKYGLVPSAVRATYVLNPGGFAHPSFTISDGARSLHLKLDGGGALELARWRQLAPLLEERYRAPQMLDWIELGPHAGALFEHLDGRPPDFGREGELLRACVELLGRLHADEEVAAELPDGGTCADHFCGWYIDCCRSDLDELPEIGALVGAPTAAWMRDEIDALEAEVRATPAFTAPAHSPVHSDLWDHNVIVRPDGEWFVIDWDDLRRGDPMLDLAILLWRVPGAEAFVSALMPAERERFVLCQRGQLLSEVVDSLADHVEARRVPEHAEAVRAAKWRVHVEALREYRYGCPATSACAAAAARPFRSPFGRRGGGNIER